MNKIINMFLVIVICCGLFTGCGKKEIVTDEFDSKTNQKCSFKGYSFEVPKNWKKDEDSTEDQQFYRPKDGLLQVGYMDVGTGIMNESLRKEIFDGFAKSLKGYEALSGSEIQVDGVKAYQQELNVKLSEKDYRATMVLFDSKDGIIVFWVNTLKGSKKDYSKDFEKIIESIVAPSVGDTEEKVEAQERTLDYIFLQESMRWDMALQEVKDTEKRELNSSGTFESKNPAYLNYKSNKTTDEYYSMVESIYCFNDNQLKAYWSSFDESKISDYKGMYDEIKNKVSEKYGECESEEVNWTDTTYQNDTEKWNDAFKYGYVTIRTTWHTSDSVIMIKWDYNKGLIVASAVPGFESQL